MESQTTLDELIQAFMAAGKRALKNQDYVGASYCAEGLAKLISAVAVNGERIDFAQLKKKAA